jgi:D-alanyl-D-alanine carboxypeptidase
MRRRSLPVVSVLLVGLVAVGVPAPRPALGADAEPADPVSLVSTWLGSLGDALRIVPATSERGEGVEPAAADTPPLPRCRYRDRPTRYGEERQWRMTLLDTTRRLPADYEPWDLVSVRRAGLAGSGRVRKVMLDDLRALASAARAKGKALAVRSAYRSYALQQATFDSWVRRAGYEQALLFSARPGHSEHQMGTAIDFTTAPGVPLSGTFGTSPAGKWLARNGWRYGFVMSYPKGKRRQSCYGYEPWHWRYVGRELAAEIQASGEVPRAFLWERFETAP